MLRPEQARHHPNAHIIRRYLGSRQEVIPDMRLRLRPNESDSGALANQGMALKPGDIILLCSDGLTDLVEDQEILAAFRTRNIQGALEELVMLSNIRGGHDNITLVAMSVPIAERPTVPLPASGARPRLISVLLLAAVAALAGLAFLGGMYAYLNRLSENPTLSRTLAPSLDAPLFQPSGATLPFPAMPSTPTPSKPNPSGTLATTRGSPAPPEVSVTPLRPTLTPWPTNTLSW
jgi:sulfur transfer complex TusBCD TusB component (DsrH family)